MSRDINELKIPVPWGHIAAKAWGDQNDEHVLVFHGRMDNAGSFDRLIPLLPKQFYYICFDLPGHGKSSHFPPFFPIHSIDYLLIYKIIVDHFKQKSYIFLGHSYGGIMALLFIRLFPQYAKKMVIIDGVSWITTEVKDLRKRLIQMVYGTLKIHERSASQKPAYTYEQVLQRIQKSRQCEDLTVEEATPLLNRAVEPVGDGKYSFTVDPRMKLYLDPLQSQEYVLNFFRDTPPQCPVLFIVAKRASPLLATAQPAFNVAKTWKLATFKYVDGGHDIHMNKREVVAELITEFLVNGKSKI